MSEQLAPRFALIPSGESRPAPGPGAMVFREFIGSDVGALISTGLVSFHDYVTDDVLLPYDEILYRLGGTGSLEVTFGGAVHRLEVGDFMFIPKGSVVRYETTGLVDVLFSLSPADWLQHLPPDNPLKSQES